MILGWIMTWTCLCQLNVHIMVHKHKKRNENTKNINTPILFPGLSLNGVVKISCRRVSLLLWRLRRKRTFGSSLYITIPIWSKQVLQALLSHWPAQWLMQCQRGHSHDNVFRSHKCFFLLLLEHHMKIVPKELHLGVSGSDGGEGSSRTGEQRQHRSHQARAITRRRDKEDNVQTPSHTH